MGFANDEASPRPLKEKVRPSNCLISCCFRGSAGDGGDEDESRPAALFRSSSAWLRQEIPDRCRGLVSRISRHRRRGSGGDFGYDPLSYALNFDDGFDDGDGDGPVEFRYRNFSSRLPASPPAPAVIHSAAL